MIHEVIHLRDIYPDLGNNDCDPYVATYLSDVTEEMKNRGVSDVAPALLILPGGGYRFVSSREAEPVALNFMAKGFRVFVLNYSIAPNRFPVAIREVAAAMELIHNNHSAWGVDTSKIAIMGFSAGGHLAAHYTNCYDCEEVRAIFPESKPVNASVLCYPVITADPQWRHTGSFQNLSGNNELTQEIIDKFSLQTKVSCSTPPTFLWHTQEDKTVPVINSILYAKALAENNVPFALHIYPFGPHGLATVDRLTRDNTPENVKQVHNWMADASRWLFDVL